MVAVFADVTEHCHSEFLSPAVSGLVSTEKESGKPVHLEKEREEDCHSQAKATDWPTGHNIHLLPEQSIDISVEATSDPKPSTNGSSKASSHAVSPKPRQRLLGLFKRERDKTDEVQSPQKEEVMIPKQKEQGNTESLSQNAADTTVDKPASVKQEAKPYVLMEVRTVQLTALQKTPFKETVTSVDADTQQEATGGRVVQLPERLSNLKDFWERKNSGPKIVLTRQEARHIDITKTGMEASHDRQTSSDVESINNNGSPQLEMTVEDTADTSQEKNSLPLTDCSLLGDLSKEDGTYRANPVLIYEETDDSLTGSLTESQISKPQKNIITPVPSSVAFQTLTQEGDIAVPLPMLSNSSPQVDSPAKIIELKHYWEKEYTGPRKTASRVKESLSSSIHRNKVISPQLDLRRSLDSRENSEGEAQTSPHKTNSSVVLTVKGFVSQSPDRLPLRSSGGTGNVQPTCLQYQVKAETEPQERPLSPSKSHTARSKDQNDEVRRSPSKTCHPKVLPRESSSPKTSRLEGSPLKTFPINIEPQRKVTEEHQGKPTPVPRQRKSPSNEAKQKMLTDTKQSTDFSSYPLPLNLEDRGTCFGNVNSLGSSTSPQSKKASEKTFTSLARCYIPHDYQYYLGPHEKSYVPSFHQEKATAAESGVAHRPQNALRDFVGNQTDNPTEGIPPRISYWIVQNKDGNPSQDTTTRACSLSWASSSSELLNFFSICICSR